MAHGFVTAAPFKHFIILNDPDAGQGSGQGTFAGNVNLGGEIAGNYTDASGVSHGFVTAPPYRTFTSFDPPGSVKRLPQWQAHSTWRGRSREFTLTRAARSTATCVLRTAPSPNTTSRAQAWVQARAPKAQASVTGGRITGNFIDSNGVNHGYLRAANGAITTFDVLVAGTGSGQGTVPEGIDWSGAITGQYIDSNGVNHGFVQGSFGAITTFDAPGAGTAAGQGTLPNTPNLFGVITGQYIDASNVHHGFLRNP